MMNSKYTWVPVFNDIAYKLLEFKNNRTRLVEIMYEILEELNLFNESNEKNCNFDKYKGQRCKYDDFDPFSFMNRLALYSFKNREGFIQKFQEKTKMAINIPEDYDGVPSVNPQLSCMLQFKDDRKENDINDFWEFFEIALKYSEDESYKNEFIKYYDICVNKPNCKFNISSCLFRLNGNFYASLDQTNRDYLENHFNIKVSKCPNGEEYLELLEKIKNAIKESKKVNSIVELSHKGWIEASKKSERKVWLYSPGENAIYWDKCIDEKRVFIGWDELGDLTNKSDVEFIMQELKLKYDNDNPIMSKCAVDDFVNNMNIGDIIIAKKGKRKLLGYGEITTDYYFDDTRNEYKHCRDVNWIKVGEWENTSGTRNAVKTLTEISQYTGYSEKLLSLMDDEVNKNIGYYWLNANPKYWSFSNIKIGETIEFTSINSKGNRRNIYRNFLSIRKGDIAIAYESTPVKKIVGLCEVVEKLNEEGNIIFKKIEEFDNPKSYSEIKDIPELQNMEYIKVHQGSLFKLTKDEYNYIIEMMYEDDNPIAAEQYDEYKVKDLLNEVYIKDTEYEEIADLLNEKNNIILQGAPGVGKTYFAERLVYSLMEEKNTDRVKFIQFHQNYSYEDFIEGIRINSEGKFGLEKGIFYNFCQKAKKNPGIEYYLIIDEINRGNLSKIFGELLMLIEKDKRGKKLTLAYSKEEFYVPKNLYIIGMMNTADRSLALLDYALRRRFSFVEMKPAFENPKFKDYIAKINNEYLSKTIERIKSLNKEIENDPSLGKGFVIGHSYFCNLKQDCKDSAIKSILKYDIIPILKEYWFDDENNIDKWSKILEVE